MLNCHQATTLISQSQDRQLTRKEKIQLKMHLMLCSACRKFKKQINSLRDFSQEFMLQENTDNKKNKK